MEKDELAEGTDLVRSLCVPQKGSLARNNLDQGLFLVVNSTAGFFLFCFVLTVLRYFRSYTNFWFLEKVVLSKIRVNQVS